jgi:hypothetical protein
MAAIPGTVYKRCGCRDPKTRRQLGRHCPKVRRRGHGSWYIDLSVAPTLDSPVGRLRHGGYRTRAEAQHTLNRLADPGWHAHRSPVTFNQWLDVWDADIQRRLRPSTVHSYQRHIALYLRPLLGHLLMIEFTEESVQHAFDRIIRQRHRSGHPISAATLRRIRDTLSSALTAAVRAKLITDNPAHGLHLPTARTAAGYSSGGDRLITTTADTAFFWDTTRSTPKLIASCTLAVGKAEIAAVVDEPKTHRPVLVLNDTSTRTLSGWNITAQGRPCSVASAQPGWSKPLPGPHLEATVTVGTSPNGLVVAARTGDGHVVLRALSGGPVTRLTTAAVTELGTPNDGTLALQSQVAGRDHVTLWDIAALSAPSIKADYRDLELPAIDAGYGGAFATANSTMLQVLSIGSGTYPVGFVPLGKGGDTQVAAGRDSVAVDLASAGLAVYRLKAGAQPRYVNFPDGYTISPGTQRANSSLALSGDGRFLAALLTPKKATDKAAGDRLAVWNVDAGVSTTVPAAWSTVDGNSANPLDVRFLPDTDTLLVDDVGGSLFRLSPSADGRSWTSATLRRSGQGREVTYGLEVGTDGIYLIRKSTKTGDKHALILRLDRDGTVRSSWDITSLHLTLLQVAPLTGGGALLVDDGGTGYRLRPDGSIGPAIALSHNVVTEAQQLPGGSTVLVATSRASLDFDTTNDVLSPVSAPVGAAYSFATTSDGAFMVESDMLNLQTALALLQPQDQAAVLCSVAGREFTTQEWNRYIGAVAPYKELCTATDANFSNLYAAAEQATGLRPPIFARTPTAQSVALYDTQCSQPGVSGLNSEGSFAWKSTPSGWIICSGGRLRWTIPASARTTVRSATVAGSTVLVVSGPFPTDGSSDRTGPWTGLDLLGSTANLFSAAVAAGTLHVSPTAISLTGPRDALVLRRDYAPDKSGIWHETDELPVGSGP